MRSARRRDQRGYALLLVFAMAAAVAVMLYLEMPRVAFEHQRNKEGLLVERGEEYVRAIELFVRKNGKYPQTVEELESFQNLRYLRRRYKDPMTGSEEWRLVHVDAAGQFVDSLVHKREEQKKESAPSILSSNIVGIGESAQLLQRPGEGGSPALQRRASDRIIPGTPGAPPVQEESDSGTPQEESRSGPPPPGAQGNQPFEPVTPGMPGTQPPGFQPGASGAAPGAMQPPGFPTQPVSSQQGGMMGQPIQQSASGFGFGGAPQPAAGRPATGSTGGFGQPGFPQGGASPGAFGPQGSQPGFGQGGFGPPGFGQTGGSSFGGMAGAQGGAPNQAIQAIRNLLTNPRGAPQGVGVPGQGGAALGGGLVGVASKMDQEGIRIYNEKTNYKEWEFLFDAKKAMEKAGAGGRLPGGGAGQQAAPGQPARPAQGGFGSSAIQGSFGGMSGGTPAPSRPSSGGSSGFGFGGGGFGSSGAGGSASPGTSRPSPGGFGSGSVQQPAPRPGPGRQ